MIKERLAIVSDFDGFLTDMGRMAEAYYGSFEDYLAGEIGIDITELGDRMTAIRALIVANPSQYALRFRGEVVAAAVADPYVLEKIVASTLISNLRQEQLRKLELPEEEELDNVLWELMRKADPHAGIIFRNGAAGFIREFNETGLVIATGSQGEKVQALISDKLGIDGLNIVGPAYKYRVDKDWKYIPDDRAIITFKGFSHDMSTRRREYYEAVMAAVNGPIGVVNGDSLAVDGLPFVALGIPFILLETEYAPYWEKDYLKEKQLGYVEKSLDEVTHRIRLLG